jgi:hypothetical protein
MPSQYAHLDGRRYVNEDFVNGVREAYPATTKKIPLGYSTYTGWTGKDEVLFTQQEPVPDVDFTGPVYQVTFDPSHPESFEQKIRGVVGHETLAEEPTKKVMPKLADDDTMTRRRLTASFDVDRVWGLTLEGRMEKVAAEREARRGQGLYGYPKSIQSSCETATRRLTKRAGSVILKAAKRDRHVLGFLETHAERGGSMAARVLIAAYRAGMPQLPPRAPVANLDTPDDLLKEAAGARLGMYGYPAKTAKIGLGACNIVREAAGVIAAALHLRRADHYAKITGFLGEHGKTAGSAASSLILRAFPAEGFKFRRRRAAVEGAPATVDEWLTWDPPSGEG